MTCSWGVGIAGSPGRVGGGGSLGRVGKGGGFLSLSLPMCPPVIAGMILLRGVSLGGAG